MHMTTISEFIKDNKAAEQEAYKKRLARLYSNLEDRFETLTKEIDEITRKQNSITDIQTEIMELDTVNVTDEQVEALAEKARPFL